MKNDEKKCNLQNDKIEHHTQIMSLLGRKNLFDRLC